MILLDFKSQKLPVFCNWTYLLLPREVEFLSLGGIYSQWNFSMRSPLIKLATSPHVTHL